MSEPHFPDRTGQPDNQPTDEERQALRQFENERAESRERYREKLSPFDWENLMD